MNTAEKLSKKPYKFKVIFKENVPFEKAKQIIDMHGYVVNSELYNNCNCLIIESPYSYRTVLSCLLSYHKDTIISAELI